MSAILPDTPLYSPQVFSDICNHLYKDIENHPLYSPKKTWFSNIPKLHKLSLQILVKKEDKSQLVTFERFFCQKGPFFGHKQPGPDYEYNRSNLEKILKTALYYFAKECEKENLKPVKVENLKLFLVFNKGPINRFQLISRKTPSFLFKALPRPFF